jgi:hypothetical protein
MAGGWAKMKLQREHRTMKSIPLLSLFFVFLGSTSELPGKSFADYAGGLGVLSLEIRAETPEEGLEGFPATILGEAVLLQYGRWSLPGESARYPLSVFEVLDSQAAFALFTRSRREAAGGERITLAVDSLLADGTLHFWRGHFFMRLRLPEQGGSPSELLDLAGRLVAAIDEPNLHPMSVVQLPAQDLIPDSVQFFLGPAGLAENPDFPAPLRSRLGFEDYAEVAMARYSSANGPLYLIGYPTADLAEQYHAEIQNSLQSYFSQDGIFSKRSGLLISLYPGPQDQATMLLDRVQYTATVRWLYEKDVTLDEAKRRRGEVGTFLGVVTRSILFTGAFILVVFFLGLTAGLVRFWMLRRFPSYEHREDMIRLGLDQHPSKAP